MRGAILNAGKLNGFCFVLSARSASTVEEI